MLPAFRVTLATAVLVGGLCLSGCGDGGGATAAGCVDSAPGDAKTIELLTVDGTPSPNEEKTTIEVLCGQLEAFRVSGTVEPTGKGFVARFTGDDRDVGTAGASLGVPSDFGFYDWEPNLIAGPLNEQKAAEAALAQNKDAVEVFNGDGYYVIRNKPSLGANEIDSAEPGRDPVTGDPIVELSLTPQGKRAFQELTQTVATRGGHFAVIYQGFVLSLPEVDPESSPDGLSADQGVDIPGAVDLAADGTTKPSNFENTVQLADLIDIGPPPITLFNTTAN